MHTFLLLTFKLSFATTKTVGCWAEVSFFMREDCSSRQNTKLIIQALTLCKPCIILASQMTSHPPNLLYSWPSGHCPPVQLSAVGHETAPPRLNCRVGGCLIGWKWQLVWGSTLHLLRQQIGVHPFVWGGGGGSSLRYMPWQTPSVALRQTDRQTLCIMCGYLLQSVKSTNGSQDRWFFLCHMVSGDYQSLFE